MQTSSLTFDAYQERAFDTIIPLDSNEQDFAYRSMGWASEYNEKMGKVIGFLAKLIRDRRMKWTPGEDDEIRNAVKKEMGDCFWMMATLADWFGLSFSEIAQANLDKLADRKARGVISGSGDNR